jgi:NAD(P)-dependent dehydrogenase (short-subunit alcohol dehydrogenase family)
LVEGRQKEPSHKYGIVLLFITIQPHLQLNSFLSTTLNLEPSFCFSMTAMLSTLSSLWNQTFISGEPTITEQNCPDQSGRVIIITGATSGVGYELAKILYAANATVYIGARSAEKAKDTIKRIREAHPTSTGHLHYLTLDLSDLSTIAPSAASFAAKESKLHILFNNAGVASPPTNSYSKQGHELQLATNCLGPYLFTRLLLPQLRAAAATSPTNTVRIIWASSQTVDMLAPADGGLVPSEIRSPNVGSTPRTYAQSKVGNWFMAVRFARELQGENIISITVNPGNLSSNIWKTYPTLNYYAISWMLKPSIWGAYTNLWAGLSEDVKKEDAGGYVVPWGKWHPSPRQDILDAMKEEGKGVYGEFNEWCDEMTRDFM